MTYCRALPQIPRTKPVSFHFHLPWRWSPPWDQSQNQVGEFSMITVGDFSVVIMNPCGHWEMDVPGRISPNRFAPSAGRRTGSLREIGLHGAVAISVTKVRENTDEAFLCRIDLTFNFPLPGEQVSFWKGIAEDD